MRIEAPSLQEAFSKAADELKCSVTELDIKVLQHPRAGLFGLFKKPAIIEATREAGVKFDTLGRNENRKKEPTQDTVKNTNELGSKKNRQKKKEQKQSLNKPQDSQGFENFFKEEVAQEVIQPEIKEKSSKKEPKPVKPRQHEASKSRHKERTILDNSIIDTFNQADSADKPKSPPSLEILNEIKQKLTKLFDVSDFDVSNIDVFAYDNETVQINLDGADAALLIGKEGHRYKALSYILFNWVNLKYNYSLRLEIAQFLKAQEDSARQYATVLAQKVNENGRTQSRAIDGVGLKIILDELRTTFPNKYVGVKNTPDGKCVVVNDFCRK